MHTGTAGSIWSLMLPSLKYVSWNLTEIGHKKITMQLFSNKSKLISCLMENICKICYFSPKGWLCSKKRPHLPVDVLCDYRSKSCISFAKHSKEKRCWVRLEVPLVLLAALSRHTLVGARSIDDDLWHSHVGMFLIDQQNTQRGIEQFVWLFTFLCAPGSRTHL